MNANMDYKNEYITFEIKKHIFAIPIKCSLGIINCRNSKISYTTMPQASKYVKYIVEQDNYYITIVQLPEVYEDIPITDSLIVLLEYKNQIIGMLSNIVDHITIPADKISEDRNTGQKHFVNNGKTYLIVDIYQLCAELEM